MLTTTNYPNLRAACTRRGFILRKARTLKHHSNDLFDGFQILSAITGSIIEGERFQLLAEDVRDWLNEFDQSNI